MIGNLTYEDVKKFVTDNPNIAAQEFGEKLKQSGPADAKIFDLLSIRWYKPPPSRWRNFSLSMS